VSRMCRNTTRWSSLKGRMVEARPGTGVASALLNAAQQIGGSLGLAVLTAVATARFDAVRPLHPTPATLAAANTSSWAYGFIVAALLLFGAAIIGGWLLRLSPDRPHPEELTLTDEAIDRSRRRTGSPGAGGSQTRGRAPEPRLCHSGDVPVGVPWMTYERKLGDQLRTSTSSSLPRQDRPRLRAEVQPGRFWLGLPPAVQVSWICSAPRVTLPLFDSWGHASRFRHKGHPLGRARRI
jgi:hypothetical protein